MEEDHQNQFSQLTKPELEYRQTQLRSDINFWGDLRPTFANLAIGLVVVSCGVSALTTTINQEIDLPRSLLCALAPAVLGTVSIKLISRAVNRWRRDLHDINSELLLRNTTSSRRL